MTRLVIIASWYVIHILGPLTPTLLAAIIRGHCSGWSVKCISPSDLAISVALLSLLVLVICYPQVRTVHGKERARSFFNAYALLIGISTIVFVLSVVDEVGLASHGSLGRMQLERAVEIVEETSNTTGNEGLSPNVAVFMTEASSAISGYDEAERRLDRLRIWSFVLGGVVVSSTGFLRRRYKLT